MIDQKIENTVCQKPDCRVYKLIFIDVEMPMQDGLTTLTNIDSIYRGID